jgi:hypothetical protein
MIDGFLEEFGWETPKLFRVEVWGLTMNLKKTRDGSANLETVHW